MFRNELRKGTANCKVQQVDATFISRNGYQIYTSAFKRYKNLSYNPVDEKSFSREIDCGARYQDIIHYWGVFFQGKLIGYSSNFIFDKTEASYSSIKIDPAYLSLNSSSILIYEMNRSYLDENRFEYVNDGYRTLLHDTNFQSFLIRKFGFIKAGLKLEVYYKPLFAAIIKALYPVRRLVVQIDPRIQAVLKLESIRRSYIGKSGKI
jgi:hypothetical protein